MSPSHSTHQRSLSRCIQFASDHAKIDTALREVRGYEAAQSTLVASLDDICKITEGNCIVPANAIADDGTKIES
jgi:hypothetical protein